MLSEKTDNVFEKDIHPDYLRIFKSAGVNINTLPVLDLGHIDFIDSKEMTAPIMKFRDCNGRPGIVLLMTNKVDMELPRCGGIAKPGEYKNTLILFQRNTDSRWFIKFGHSDSKFQSFYLSTPKSIFELLEEILKGTNNIIGLATI